MHFNAHFPKRDNYLMIFKTFLCRKLPIYVNKFEGNYIIPSFNVFQKPAFTCF